MKTPANSWDFVAGALCLDFANTVGGNRGGSCTETLGGFGDLAAWLRAANALPVKTLRAIQQRARERPQEAARAFARAIELREAVYRVASGLAASSPKRRNAARLRADLDLINDVLAEALFATRLRPISRGFELAWDLAPPRPDQALWPIARSAVDVLTSPRLARLRECASETCGWLFLDETKNRSRRWCEMQSCGNRAKIRRFRQRRVPGKGFSRRPTR